MLSRLVILAVLLVVMPTALAGFDASANDTLAVYWGQNSAGQNGTQSRLASYCFNSDVDIILLAFLSSITNPTTVNFANAGDNCTLFGETTLLSCPQLETDIQQCQSQGKTIMLSIGGATYTEGGFSSASLAQQWADTIWAMFGPVQSGENVNRPFGSAVIDGFDFDFESTTQNMVPFAQQLRSSMESAPSKKFYLSAAPQCPVPDAAEGQMLNDSVSFDFINVQFYNNYCGVQAYTPGASTQNNFNFATWDNWAKTASKNPDVKILLGIPASATAASSGFVSGSQLDEVVAYSKGFSSFGGTMVWDMSQLYANSGYLANVVRALGGSAQSQSQPQPTTTSTSMETSAGTLTAGGASATGVPQWEQCGGQNYTGPTVCASPYQCVNEGQWWSSCQ